MPTAILRLCYRVAAPLAHAYWALTRARMRGAKCVLLRGAGEQQQVLLVRQSYGNRKLWHFPGGLLKRGEKPLDGAQRELREELGLELVGPRELVALDLRIYGHVDRVHYFAGTLGVQSTELAPHAAEIAEARWFSLDRPPIPLGSQVREVLTLLASPAGKPGSPARG